MSPLTRPFKTTVGTLTDPSMQPCSLITIVAVEFCSAFTLPLIRPSRCSPPPPISTSPLMRVCAPISV